MSNFECLPTGKHHVSFSEISEWVECSWRHKLKHVDKIDLSKPSPIPGSGTALHSACEEFLKTKVMNSEIALNELSKLFSENVNVVGFEEHVHEEYKNSIIGALKEIPDWFNQTFPNWEYIDAEHELYEQIENQPHAFKGYIDGVISTVNDKGKKTIWLLDWKFTGYWSPEKKSDEKVKRQLIFYKHFWSRKTNTPLKDIKCAFVLIKRSGKPGTRCELVPVSVGDVSIGKSLKVMNNMIHSVKKGMYLKNRESCKWCDYKDTVHCPPKK